MKETIDNARIWNAAARTGIVFGLFSGICLTVRQLALAHGASDTVSVALGGGLWALEFFGCIALMVFFMKKLCRDFEGVTRADCFRYGRRIALLSGLILAAVHLVLVSTVAREATEAALDQALALYAPMLDTNANNALDDMRGNLPAITFFSQWLWCWIYGTILAAILSRFIPGEEKR